MILKKFWQWYENNYKLNLGIATMLFLVQIVHLCWLFVEVIWMKLFGSPLVEFHEAPKLVLIFVDYTEIPAIFAVSAVYVNELRKKLNWKSLMYLLFINSQWIHLFWITDEFVIDTFVKGISVSLPAWLAWIAILIDYLELPVIVDTIKRFASSLKERSFVSALGELKEE